MNELPIGARLGNYAITARIGEGGMGTVYAAVHVGLGKRVAIKALRPELASDPDICARFVREGKAAAAVRHPNVVDVDDVGVFEGRPYLVMELLDGENLGHYISRRAQLPVTETADIVVPVLSAMAQAHRAGIVHRDLKPDNIFLARSFGGTSVPKILDFGISKLREAQSLELTGQNTLLGTPYYMSPEQAASARDVDARSDLYSIGVIIYHCITGRVPFAGTSLAQVLGQILHAPPIPPSESVPDVPAEFERILLRLMHKDPAQRYPDANSLARELMRFASDRVALTYRTELDASVATGGGAPTLQDRLPGSSTLTPTSRSIMRTPGATATWLAGGALVLALIGVMLWWQSGTSSLRTPGATSSPAPSSDPSASTPPTAATTSNAASRPPVEPGTTAAPRPPQGTPALPSVVVAGVAQPIENAKLPPPKARPKPTKKPAQSVKPAAASPPSPAPAPDEDVWGNRK